MLLNASDIKLQNKLRSWSFYLVLISGFIASMALVGWQFDMDVFKRPHPKIVAINPTTALLIILCSISFYLTHESDQSPVKIQISKAINVFVLSVSLIRIYTLIWGMDFHVDELLFPEKIKSDVINQIHNQMALSAAICFVLTAIALQFFHSEIKNKVLVSHALAVLTATISLLSILGYLYQVDEFYRLFDSFPLALYAALCFFLISIALLFATPDNGIMQEFTRKLTGSVVAHVFIPAGIIIPTLLGLVRLLFQWKGNISTEYGVAILVMCCIILFLAATWYNTFLLNRRDLLKSQTETTLKETEQSEKKYKLLFEKNPMPMWMVTREEPRIVGVNDAAIAHYGYSREEFSNLKLHDIFISENNNDLLDKLTSRFDEKNNCQLWQHRKKDGTIIQVESVSEDIIYEGQPVRLMLSNDITEKVNAGKLLNKSLNDVRQLASHLENVREEERIRIAREIHDELGQTITGIKMEIIWVKKIIKEDDTAVNEKLNAVIEMLDGGAKTVRRISTELRPGILDDIGLIAAIEWQSQEFESRSGIKTIFTTQIEVLDLPDKISTALFRIFQESLTNIARHSKADSVKIYLAIDQKNVMLRVTDNGKGFEADRIDQSKTLGLIGMKERSLMLGGEYKIISEPGKGSMVEVSIPIFYKT